MTFRHRLAKSLDPSLKSTIGLSVGDKIVTIIILISLFVAIIQTEPTIYNGHESLFLAFEWLFTILFTIEYLLRVWVSIENHKYPTRLSYMYSPAAILDLMTLILILFTALGTKGFILRMARLLRVLRIAKLGRYSVAMRSIGQAIYQRRFELTISLGIGFFSLILTSSMLYVIEGRIQPAQFGSIPRAMWWSVITLTTVGYGDVYPITAFGKLVGAITAIIGIGLIAIPTGILAASFSDAVQLLKEKHGKKEK